MVSFLRALLLLLALPASAAANELQVTTRLLATEAWTDAEPCGTNRIYWQRALGWGELDLRLIRDRTIDPTAEIRQLACFDPEHGDVVVHQAIPGNGWIFYHGGTAPTGLALGDFYTLAVLPVGGAPRLLLVYDDALAHDRGPSMVISEEGYVEGVGRLGTPLVVAPSDDMFEVFGPWPAQGRLLFAGWGKLYVLTPSEGGAATETFPLAADIGDVTAMAAFGESVVVSSWSREQFQLQRCTLGGAGFSSCALLHRWAPGSRGSSSALGVSDGAAYIGARGCDGQAEPAVVRIDLTNGTCDLVLPEAALLALLPRDGGADRLVVNRGGETILLTVSE